MFEETTYVSGGKFASRGEWIHPRRIIDSYEIILVTKGTVRIAEGDTDYALKRDDILLLHPDRLHFGTEASRDVEFYWLHFSSPAPPDVKLLHIDDPYHLMLLFSQLLHFQSFGDGFSEACNYLTRLILIELRRHRLDRGENGLTSRIAEWIRINSDISLKVTDVAEKFGYNPDYLNRLFQRVYSKSLKEYITECKMQNIKALLMTSNSSLQEISMQSGFSDYKYFLKFFKANEKMTPTEFRNIYFKIHTNNK